MLSSLTIRLECYGNGTYLPRFSTRNYSLVLYMRGCSYLQDRQLEFNYERPLSSLAEHEDFPSIALYSTKCIHLSLC